MWTLIIIVLVTAILFGGYYIMNKYELDDINSRKTIGFILGGIGYGLIWHEYGINMALLILLVILANNLEQTK